MELKNGEIYSAYLALDRLSNEKLPIKVAFGLAKVSVRLEPIFRAIEKVRITLLKKYGVENQANYAISGATKENRSSFEMELDELLGQMSDIGEVTKVKLPETTASDKVLEIEPGILAALDKFVEI